MAIRNIIGLDNPILRKKAIKVQEYGKAFQTLVDDMIETLIDAPGVGLAAPQVAISQRLIVVRLPDDEESKKEYGDQAGVIYVVANPEIVKESREMVEGVEACLSIPGYYGTVDRHETIVVKGFDRNGAPFRLKAKDWLARVFQHEIDHLDGKLYIDIATDIWKHSESDDEQSEPEPTEQESPAKE